MNKENKLLMQSLHYAKMRQKYPSAPEAYLPIKKYNDNSANALTKCIIDFLIFSGYQAERINTMGRYVDDSKIITDVVGFQRKIGSGKYIKGTGTKGSADISATIKGRSVKIEVKYGKDRQSDYQKEYQQAIERAGGVYIIARDFDGFKEWYDNFIKNIK
jgi:hypothetical protein